MITLDLDRTPTDGVCKAARRLIRAGHDPETILHVVRGDTLVFLRDQSLKAWASLDVRETPERSIHLVKHRAFDLAAVRRSASQ